MNLTVIKADFEKLVNLFSEIETLNEDIKLIKESLKEENVDATLISKIAKAKAQDKTGKLQESTEELLELIKTIS